ncbi:MAG: DedA family protein [Mycobacterium sp.]|uniref:DedA family protein n=1 Tax=Mycobacterium sp. TaxID=1785 RepID=UPI001EC14E95|nr:DedA family protein [Mycobacterium sp.]MBW0019746.1 DedA family protein [Mycobacterium sp.]
MSSPLPGVLGSLAPLLDRYGYAAVIVLVGLEGVGIPLPGQIVLIVAGVYAGVGQLHLLLVLAAGLLAAIGGDNVGYAIGRYGGRRLVLRFGRYVCLTEKRLAATERFFARRGNIVVPVGRFVDGLRQATGIAAGLAQMGWRRYMTYNALGSAVWVGIWVFAGYLAGDHIEAIYDGFFRYEKYVLAAGAAAALAVLVGWVLKRRSGHRAAAEC